MCCAFRRRRDRSRRITSRHLYAAQTLRQLMRISAADGRLPCLTIVDYPRFRTRGMYIEGGQERFGRIVDKDYLLEQIRRLAEFKMNTLVIECYNLFPFASFPPVPTKARCRRRLPRDRRREQTLSCHDRSLAADAGSGLRTRMDLQGGHAVS